MSALLKPAERLAGGRDNLRRITVLAAALGLAGADTATVSAVASDLKHVLGITNTGIGLLVSTASVAAAVATLPVGVLTDRVRRTRLLAGSVGLWGGAMVMAGAAQTFWQMLIARMLLGAVTATTGPTVASLIGDYFPAATRARVYGLVLGGELVGTGIGFVVSGQITAFLSWRFAFWWLVPPIIPLIIASWRLPEPRRGGQSGLDTESRDRAEKMVTRRDIEPDPRAVLREDPARKRLWWVVRYVLRVRSNVVIMVASALGYFYFTGFRSFIVVFAGQHYGISESVTSALTLVVGVGALAGVFAGGRIADRLLGRGRLTARLLVPAVCLALVPAALGPGIAVASAWVAVPLLTAGAGLLGAANPPMDAARLDVLHPAVWGRGEAVRTTVRTLAEAAAPTLFGFLADSVFGPDGLMWTFLVCLVAVLAAALGARLAARSYPRDVAAVAASK
ncbi:MFS transporter [Amycolatopsis sp. K13G38]|uniref:MFS transporter n=1 Tax=Amycolatopsis acididurans TaxID=2724524 RepID=A0ABX1J7K3_9PSEU|nr:MFS transporter [Amycolatopsis acididurans]NKQ54325.1 MFS transporter [Amycolatopsis acididurans]